MKVHEQDEWMIPIICYLKEKDNFLKTGMRHERYRLELLSSSLLMMSYIDEDTPSPIFDVLTRKRSTMYCERYTKESTVTMQKQGLWWEKHLEQVIIGQHYRRTYIT